MRQNFTSYAASLGIPAAVTALWQGHATTVAERFYRAQVFDRQQGKSLEQAMGLGKFVQKLAGETLSVNPKRIRCPGKSHFPVNPRSTSAG